MSRKHSITLVELLISLSLLTLLLSTLFFWYRHHTVQKNKIEKLKHPYLEERYLWQRLDHIVLAAESPVLGDSSTLVFRFDRGVSRDPKLSDRVVGKIYHDPGTRTLCLGVWPDFEDSKAVTEPSLSLTLLDEVDELKLRFYSPPNPFKKVVDPDQVGNPRPQDGWQSVWTFKQVPAFVHMTLTRGINVREIYLDLNQPIVYPVNTEANG